MPSRTLSSLFPFLLAGTTLAQPPAQPPATPPAPPQALKGFNADAKPVASVKPDGYAQRLHNLILAAQPPRADDDRNGWADFIAHVNRTAGILDQLTLIDPAGQAAAKTDHPDSSTPDIGHTLARGSDNPATAAWLRAWFDRAEEAGVFGWLVDFNTHTRFVPPVDETDDLISIALPELGAARSTAKLLNERLEYAAEIKSYDAYTQSFAGMLTLARASDNHGTLINHLVAIAINNVALSTITDHLIAGRPGHDTRVALLQAIDERPLLPVTVSLQAERLMGQSAIEMFFDQIAAGKHPALFDANALSLPLIGTRQQNLDHYNAFMDLTVGIFNREPKASADAAAKAEAFIKGDGPTHFPLTSLLAPALSRFRTTCLQSEAQHDGVRILLALSLYHDQHHAYPDTLAALVPDFLPALPDDPYNPGHPFGYRRIDPASDPLHRAFLLYAVGLDGVDNQGATDKDNSAAFKPTTAAASNAGMDYVINWTEPRPTAKKPADQPSDAPKP